MVDWITIPHYITNKSPTMAKKAIKNANRNTFFKGQNPHDSRGDIRKALNRKKETLTGYFLVSGRKGLPQQLLVVATKPPQVGSDNYCLKLYTVPALENVSNTRTWKMLREFSQKIDEGCIDYNRGTLYAANSIGEVITFTLTPGSTVVHVGNFSGVAEKVMFNKKEQLIQVQVVKTTSEAPIKNFKL
jgi:hypothetical protein